VGGDLETHLHMHMSLDEMQVLAPISEVYGRNPMYRWSTVAFTRKWSPASLRSARLLSASHAVLYLPIALAPNVAAVCINRFLQGIAGSVGSTMVGGMAWHIL